jgi:hypothetical protein
VVTLERHGAVVTAVGSVLAGTTVVASHSYIDLIIDEDGERFYYTPLQDFADE